MNYTEKLITLLKETYEDGKNRQRLIDIISAGDEATNETFYNKVMAAGGFEELIKEGENSK